MASGSAAKRAQGERAAGRHPRPRPSAGLTVCPLVSSHRGGHSTEVAAHRQEGGADKNAEEDSIASNTEMKIRILGQINSECQRKEQQSQQWKQRKMVLVLLKMCHQSKQLMTV
ncbi:uncharacterized protein LOC123585331 isoform X5 [Leopardus geoffroyi]|uniref:uncharacterized protein LOC123585331 isoform X5 n=1 Tax=Leopardus geoffroyi TaxID=46844 RepID=UPI001E25EBF5|nr:uncharacterized protein LOC123585331 isoform X5 [Leopardus geoffroyi]XP_045309328.1 uncharacterized protein LOC123585331 isoform X5 [Leopardus geoffroyi]